jgi:hypothetical protein
LLVCISILNNVGVGDIDRDNNADADNRQDEEHISQHAQKPQEDSGIHADLINKLFLLRLPNHNKPRPGGFAESWRRMSFVRMFGFRGVNNLVVGSKEGKGEGNGASNCEGDGCG